ncbi:MAG: hypothetical protein ACM3JJ_13090 [Hyphomicrobiales bacterium]
MLPDLIRISLLGGLLAVEKSAGWSLMLSQPLVGACLAGALIDPGPEWELWVLRIPIAVGALLQLLLTDSALPAAQRSHDTATAGIVGTAVAIVGVTRLHDVLPGSLGGLLWVVVGTATGLLSGVLGGWFARLHARPARAVVARAEALATSGATGAFERFVWGGLGRTFLTAAVWTWGATILFAGLALTLLPRVAVFLTTRRIGFVFATLLGAALVTAFHAHVRGRRHGMRWAALGALVVTALLFGLRGGGS